MVKDNNVGPCLHPLLILFASWIVAENKNMMCVVIYYYRQTYSCSLANFKGKNEQIILQIDLRNIECFFYKSCFLNLWNLSSQTNCNAWRHGFSFSIIFSVFSPNWNTDSKVLQSLTGWQVSFSFLLLCVHGYKVWILIQFYRSLKSFLIKVILETI